MQVLLSSIAKLPETCVWELPILTETERVQQQQFQLSSQLAQQLPPGLQVQLGSPLLLLDSNLQPLPLAVLGKPCTASLAYPFFPASSILAFNLSCCLQKLAERL